MLNNPRFRVLFYIIMIEIGFILGLVTVQKF